MSYVLTGAFGWIGKNALARYEQIHGRDRLLEDVFPLASEPKLIDFGSPHGPILAQGLEEIASLPVISGMFHCAFIKRRSISTLGVEAFTSRNRRITDLVIQALQRSPGCPVVHLSSGAASPYDRHLGDVHADPYGVLKREEELRLSALAECRPCLSLRVYALSGPLFSEKDDYALLSFVRSALSQGFVEVKAEKPVLRSFVHVDDLVSVGWRFLLSPAPSGYSCIDACTLSLSIHSLAEAVSVQIGVPLRVPAIDPAKPMDSYQGDGAAFLALADRMGIHVNALTDHISSVRGYLEGL